MEVDCRERVEAWPAGGESIDPNIDKQHSTNVSVSCDNVQSEAAVTEA